MKEVNLYQGDCFEVLKSLADSSVDSVVTDPPYGISFMGKKWDYDVPSAEVWQECLRVLKPGGHLLAFAGTRTQHRMAVNIEDAGFEIRDLVMWHYGQGFPKSKNLGNGFGCALKPATEPITMARKPLDGTLEANFAKHGTGGLNIDGCRVATDEVIAAHKMTTGGHGRTTGRFNETYSPGDSGKFLSTSGRWPANLIHDGSDEVLAGFPESASGSGGRCATSTSITFAGVQSGPQNASEFSPYADAGKGSSARFFYCAKASKKDRGEGNNHVTVKPTNLMRYLCRLVTPPNGVVLDPFMGSGSTGKAAVLEGFRFIGIERESQYLEIAEARISAVNK